MKVTVWNKHTKERYIGDVPPRLPHEHVAAHFQDDPVFGFFQAQDAGDLPHAFLRHPVSCRVRRPRDPIGTKKDSFVAMYYGSLNDGQRQLIARSDNCQCGCHGQCTFSAIVSAIAWTLNCLAEPA